MLNRYNTQAIKLTPPCPTLSWKEIIDYSFLGEFNLLQHSRADIHNEPWAHVTRREAMVKYFKLCRAQEEVTQLNIEIQCLRTFIHDETIHTTQVISQLSLSDPWLATELQQRWQLRNSVNQLHIQCLNVVESSASFTGPRGIGTPAVALVRSDFEGEEDPDSEMVGTGEEPIVGQDMTFGQEDLEDSDHVLEKITDFVLTITD